MDPLLYLLIYLPLHSHGLIPSFAPPICCFPSSFSAQINQFRVSGSNFSPRNFSERYYRQPSGTTTPGASAVLPGPGRSGTTAPVEVLPLGPGTEPETAFQHHGFWHNFIFRTLFLVIFVSNRSYRQSLHHHSG